MAGLPPPYRLVVFLFYVEEHRQEEIAALLGIARRTVETRLYRARALLRRVLEKEGRG